MEAINIISLLLIIALFTFIFANILGELQKLRNS